MKLLIRLALTVLILDVFSKTVVGLFLTEPIDLYILELSAHQNRVLAWGIPVSGAGPIVLALMALVAVGWIIWKSRKNLSPGEEYGWGMIVGGGIGNLCERIWFGSVTDFIDFGWFPVFNMADIGITMGVLLLLSRFVMDSKKPK